MPSPTSPFCKHSCPAPKPRANGFPLRRRQPHDLPAHRIREVADRYARRRGPTARASDREPALAATLRPRHRRTPSSDFGTRGDPPSHPELLDYLASELIRGGWKLKPIHKLIVTSAAYQQCSARDEAKVKIDPDNTLVWRQPMRRLTAEVIRDSILFVGGKLNTTMYGPGTLSEESPRRSIYFTMKRSKLIPALIVFDAPDGTVGVGDRSSTTIAPQALHLMNNPQVRGAAHGFARQVLADAKIKDEAAVKRAYEMALCREPTPEELTDALPFIRGKTGDARETALADFCQVLFCLNEFLYAE